MNCIFHMQFQEWNEVTYGVLMYEINSHIILELINLVMYDYAPHHMIVWLCCRACIVWNIWRW